jgi:hypothetical protein
VTKTLGNFEQIIYADFEFVSRHGELPDVVCLAWHEEPSGQTHCLWRDQLGAAPPYRTDDRVLFVCFVANAELGCHLALNWPLPVNVIDLSAEFRRHVNGRAVPEGKGLLGALAYFNLDRIDAKQKDAMRERITRGWPFSDAEREQILRYGASDVDPLPALLGQLVKDDNCARARHYGEFVAASALMEHRASRSTARNSANLPMNARGPSCATPWCRRSTPTTAFTSKARTATGISVWNGSPITCGAKTSHGR